MDCSSLDLAVVGSGVSGLCAAKTYLELHPSANVAVLEAAPGLGGVWALDRIYPHLQTNNLNGFFEYSDFPFSMANLDVPEDEHIPGRVVYKYLAAYSKHFDLDRRIYFTTRVNSAEYQGSLGWLLTVTSPTGAYKIQTAKLIVASGLCSRPNIPQFSHCGSASFSAPILHGSQMPSHPETFEKSTSVAVFGGTKMAWDAAYAYAAAGVHVNWIIRKSGHGPCWMTQAKVTPLKRRAEDLVMTRFMTWFSPCMWASGSFAPERWARRFFHRTGVGRALVKILFYTLQADMCASSRYDRCTETAKLRPWTDLFNVGGNQGVLNANRDVLGMVERGQISVHVDELVGFSDHSVILKERGGLHVDALICCTGWKFEPSIKFLPGGIERKLGLPYCDPESGYDATLRAVDAEINDTFPVLNNRSVAPPHSHSDNMPNHGYRLYRFMAPQPPYFHDRTIAFIGMQINFGVPLTVQAQSLWIAAYFHNQIPHLQPGATDTGSPELTPTQYEKIVSEEKPVEDQIPTRMTPTATLDQHIRATTLLHTRFIQRRYAWGFGERFPDFVFELMPYLDMLLDDLGLVTSRKLVTERRLSHSSWINKLTSGLWSRVKGTWKEVFEPYGKNDYEGLVGEWLAARKEKLL